MMVVATHVESCQRVVIAQPVLDRLASQRQLSWFAREAGGQIFGVVEASRVIVQVATGPYRGDQRWRFTYRSSQRAAQKAIDEQAAAGLIYLGEWHTHPEDLPSASHSDLEAMVKLQRASNTRLATLLMLIQGRADGVAGIAVYSCGDSSFIQWVVAQDVRSGMPG